MHYTGSKLDWEYRYGNFSTQVGGFWIYVNYTDKAYTVQVDARKLKATFASADDAKIAAVKLAVRLFQKALIDLE